MSFTSFSSFTSAIQKNNSCISVVLPSGIANFHFNPSDICGNIVKNYANNGINGVLAGGTSNPTIVTTTNQQSWINSGSMYFNGQNQYFTIPNLTLPSNGFSIACWFNYTSLTRYRRLYDFCTTNQSDSYVLATIADSKILLYNSVSGKAYNSGPTLVAGTWYHLVWTISSTGVWTYYLNNVKYNPNVTSYPAVLTCPLAYVGYASNTSVGDTTQSMYGSIDELQISGVLTDAQVNSLYTTNTY